MDVRFVVVGLVTGLLVGLTGTGGGSLTTPLLILLFRVPAVTAVGTDLAFSAITKWVGSAVHRRQGTVNGRLVRQLAVGSIPGTIVGLFLLRLFEGARLGDEIVVRILGVALVLVSLSLLVDIFLLRGRGGWVPGMRMPSDRPVVNAVLGAVVGLVLALTSVGSGTLVLAGLVAIYPSVRAAELVGSDVAHAAILVTVAAIGHLALGTVRLPIVAALLVGSIPGVLAGSRLALRAPDRALRPILAAVLLLTGVKLV